MAVKGFKFASPGIFLNEIDQSQLPKPFFIDKFNHIKPLWDWAETQFIIDEENN